MNPPGETGSGADVPLGSVTSPHGVLPHWRVWGARSWVTVGVYLFLVVVLLALLPRLGEPVTYFLVAVLAVYLIRYLSVQYVLSEEALYANRLFGSRRIPLGTIRKIQLTSLRDSAQQVNLARGVFRYCRMRKIPLVVAISKADLLKEFYLEVEQVLTSRGYQSNFDMEGFLTRQDGTGLGSILLAREGLDFHITQDTFLMASAIATGEGRPLLYGDAGAESDEGTGLTAGIPVMVNTTLPLSRICQRILAGASPSGVT